MGIDKFSNTFVLGELERYKLTIEIDNQNIIKTGNDFDYLKDIFDTIIDDHSGYDTKLVVSIYDYDKNTNVEYYNSDDER